MMVGDSQCEVRTCDEPAVKFPSLNRYGESLLTIKGSRLKCCLVRPLYDVPSILCPWHVDLNEARIFLECNYNCYRSP